GLTGGDHAVELLHLRDAGVHGLEVGEHHTEPAEVHVRHAATLGLRSDGLLGLLLRADEQDRAAVGHGLAHEPVGRVDPLQALLEIDDVDPVALTEDEPPHLRVPAPGLVTEVDSGLQQLLHADNSHATAPFLWFGPPPANAREPLLRRARSGASELRSAGVRILEREPEWPTIL